MISVQSIFLRVNTDLSQKGKLGYTDNDQFNRAANEAQDMLFEFYAERYKLTQRVVDSLLPFLKNTPLPIVAGLVATPSDYGHLISIEYRRITNTNTQPTVELYNIPERSPNEVRVGYSKPIKSNPRTYCYRQSSSGFLIEPSSVVGNCVLTYLRRPSTVSRAVTLDVTNDNQNYTPTGTVDFEWPAQEATNIVDFMLLSKGIEVQRPELLEFFARRKMAIPQTDAK